VKEKKKEEEEKKEICSSRPGTKQSYFFPEPGPNIESIEFQNAK
jgi:hypothetical protein